MSSEKPDGLRKELLDDFYAECDELITSIRRTITAQETAVRHHQAEPNSLAELFRAMHSFKGICAIAGVRPAEELAHAVEDLLRALTRQEVAVSAAILDLLLVAAERLNTIVAAHRQDRVLPGVEDLLPRLAAYLARPQEAVAAEEPAAATSDPVAAARARGLAIWRATFAPSPALEQRGVKINTIRERLAQAAEILSATPAVRPGGGLSFVFVLGVRQPPADLPAWERDGVQLEPGGKDAPSVNVARDTSPAESDSSSLTPSHIVRVDLGQLDDLMRITGEIIIHRSRLEDRLGQRQVTNDELKEIDLALARSLRELRAAVSRVRLVPVAEIFSRMPYVLRDLTRHSSKQARVVLDGEQTEIDKYLVERLKEPLLHLVRNAFAHAVEPPAERLAAGKAAEATIRLSAARVGDSVEIAVTDDGKGIDAPAVAARAAALDLKVPAIMDSSGILSVLCQPGFSTRESADRAAGRGVGMAVVLTTVRELGGSLRLQTKLGIGTTFTLRLPLTLSIADALIVNVATQICAVPQAHVEEIIQVPLREIRSIQQTEVVPYRGGLLPLVQLRRMFKLAAAGGDAATIVVVSSERGATGLVVDRVQSRREIVLRTLSDPLLRVPGISGATELGDGRPILVLDPAAITAGVVRPPLDSLSPAIPREATVS